jgi:NADPH:quinone reductase-like Zn-dependent oxidoreductase
MKAIVQRRYGNPDEVLELCEVERPEPSDDEVLVKVHASSVNPADWFSLVGRPSVLRLSFGLMRPRRQIGGMDVAGIVEAVGAKVTRFRPGDEVFGELRAGAYAEYVAAPEDTLAAKPEKVSFSDAAAAPLAGVAALQGIRDAGGVQSGHRVLVNGASGGVGTFAVQVAKTLGAHVTGVCSTRNLDFVRSVGADEVVDYVHEDFTQHEQAYDVVFDLIGNHSMSAYRRALRPDGVYVAATGKPGGAVLGPLPFLFRVMLSSVRRRPKMKVFAAKRNADDLAALAHLIDKGDVVPAIDRSFGLSDIAAALTHQGEGHAQGKTVVTVASPPR